MKTILIIDDDPNLRRIVSAVLRQKRFEPMEADSGPAGVQLARARRPDLVLCDLYLVRENGLEVLAELRRDETTACTPFILMTGMDDPSAMRRGMDGGADDFLHKPFTGEELITAIESRLKQHSAIKSQAEETNRRLLALLEASGDLVAILDPGTMEISQTRRHDRVRDRGGEGNGVRHSFAAAGWWHQKKAKCDSAFSLWMTNPWCSRDYAACSTRCETSGTWSSPRAERGPWN